MYTFGAYDYVRESLVTTAGNCNDIFSYCLYWILSIRDYYYLTNDTTIITELSNEIQILLNQSISVFGTNPNLGFYGQFVFHF